MAKEDSGRGATGFSGWKVDVSLSLLVKGKIHRMDGMDLKKIQYYFEYNSM